MTVLAERILTEDQEAKFLDAIKRPRDHVLAKLYLHTGARLREIVGNDTRKCLLCEHYQSEPHYDKAKKKRWFSKVCGKTKRKLPPNPEPCPTWIPWFHGLRVEDIDWAGGTIVIRRKRHAKEFRVHRLHVDAETLDELKRFLAESKIKSGRIFDIGGREVEHLFEKYSRAVGFNVVPHVCRHVHITRAYDASDPFKARERAGHANLNTTLRYTHLTMKHQKRLIDDMYGKPQPS